MKLYFKYDSLYQLIFIFAQLVENEGKRNFNSPKASYVLEAIRSTISFVNNCVFEFFACVTSIVRLAVTEGLTVFAFAFNNNLM